MSSKPGFGAHLIGGSFPERGSHDGGFVSTFLVDGEEKSEAFMRIIGVPSTHRNVHAEVQNPLVSAQYVKVKLFPQGTRLKRLDPRFGFVTAVGAVRANDAQAYHSRQTLLLTKKPWFVTIDSLMPLYPRPYFSQKIHDGLFAILAHDSCRGVLPYSEYARNIMIVRNSHSPLLTRVLDKTMVIHPSVDHDPVRAHTNSHELSDGPLRLLFVGDQFFTKGGHWLVRAFQKNPKLEVQLTVVSSMNPFCWVVDRKNEKVGEYLEIMKNDRRISYQKYLANDAIRELMYSQDVFFMPSIGDTFGLVFVEAMASGMALVGTNCLAQPEVIEDSFNGHTIKLPLNEERRVNWSASHEKTMAGEVEAMLRELTENRELVRVLKGNSLIRFRERFSREVQSDKFEHVYRRI